MSARRALRVLVVTPLGRGGAGGIDRMMDQVRAALAAAPDASFRVTFATTRGRGPLLLALALTTGVAARLLGARVGLGPDLVHINLSSHGSVWRKLLIAHAARLAGAPYIIHLHGSRFREYWSAASAVQRGRMRAMFARADRVIALGSVWRDFLAEQIPEISGRIVIAPNAVATPQPAPARAPGPVRLLFLGRIGPRKGVPELIAALAGLPRDGAWRAILAGDGDLAATQAKITALDLSAAIELPGWLDGQRANAALVASDILVLPSRAENLPMSIIEAMAQGKAIIATPVGAIGDIITDNVTGLLVPVGDVAALRQVLQRLIGDPQLRCRLGAAAAEFHRNHLDLGDYLRRLKQIWAAGARTYGPPLPPHDVDPLKRRQ